MPIDADAQTWTQWILTAFGVGGGGYKIITHETRIARLEEDRKGDVQKIDANSASMSKMEGTLDQVSKTVNSIRDMLLERGNQ